MFEQRDWKPSEIKCTNKKPFTKKYAFFPTRYNYQEKGELVFNHQKVKRTSNGLSKLSELKRMSLTNNSNAIIPEYFPEHGANIGNKHKLIKTTLKTGTESSYFKSRFPMKHQKLSNEIIEREEESSITNFIGVPNNLGGAKTISGDSNNNIIRERKWVKKSGNMYERKRSGNILTGSIDHERASGASGAPGASGRCHSETVSNLGSIRNVLEPQAHSISQHKSQYFRGLPCSHRNLLRCPTAGNPQKSYSKPITPSGILSPKVIEGIRARNNPNPNPYMGSPPKNIMGGNSNGMGIIFKNEVSKLNIRPGTVQKYTYTHTYNCPSPNNRDGGPASGGPASGGPAPVVSDIEKESVSEGRHKLGNVCEWLRLNKDRYGLDRSRLEIVHTLSRPVTSGKPLVAITRGELLTSSGCKPPIFKPVVGGVPDVRVEENIRGEESPRGENLAVPKTSRESTTSIGTGRGNTNTNINRRIIGGKKEEKVGKFKGIEKIMDGIEGIVNKNETPTPPTPTKTKGAETMGAKTKGAETQTKTPQTQTQSPEVDTNLSGLNNYEWNNLLESLHRSSTWRKLFNHGMRLNCQLRPPTMPPQMLTKPKTLILDLDQTLICHYNSARPLPNTSPILSTHLAIPFYKRPGLDPFLNEMSKFYELILFTASEFTYANDILEKIDPQNKYFTTVLARNHCSCVVYGGMCMALKEVSMIKGRDLSNIVLLDDSIHAWAMDLDNLVPAKPFHGALTDQFLNKIKEFLIKLSKEEDVRSVLRLKYKLKERWNDPNSNKMIKMKDKYYPACKKY